MAVNKFATMIHKNTNRTTLILVYALLEWVLIILLLLNSLFSYLIVKFADCFCLKRPCLWCSRLDHIFEPTKYYKNSFRDLVCDDHANEISKLGYCSNHRKLAESQHMCEDCLSSSRSDCIQLSKKLGFLQVGEDEGMENGEDNNNLKCSCCSVVLKKKWNFPYLLIKPSWEVLDYPQKQSLVAENGGIDGFSSDEGNALDGIRSDGVAVLKENDKDDVGDGDVKESELEKEEENFSCFISSFDCNEMAGDEDGKDDVVAEKGEESMEFGENSNISMEGLVVLPQVSSGKEGFPEIVPKHLEFYIGGHDCHLIPVEFKDSSSTAVESQRIYKFREEDRGVSGDGEGDVILDFDFPSETPMNRYSSGEKVKLLETIHESEDETSVEVVESMESNEKKKEEASFSIREDQRVSGDGDVILDFEFRGETPVGLVVEKRCSSGEVKLIAIQESEDETSVAVAESMESNEATETSLNGADDHVQTKAAKDVQVASSNEATLTPLDEADDVPRNAAKAEQVSDEQTDETEAELSRGTNIPDHDPIEGVHVQHLYECKKEDPSTNFAKLHANADHGKP